VLDLFRTFAVAAVAIMLGLRLMAGDISLAPALMALILIPEYFTVVRRYAADFHATLDGQNNLAAICDFLQSKAPGVQSDFDLQQELTTLTLNNVYYRYDNEDHNALRDINLQIKAPMKVGIIGTSGSGKSSLAHLLAGFAQPSAGNINVNGNNIYSLDASWWQRKVAYIPQNPHIFSATLRENVSFYNTDATDEAILEALRIVGLDELDQLDLNTPIGEGGRALSGGQTQRVALARMLLDPQRTIWVLDEPSAHLDVETELDLKLRMLPLFENKLVFFATHRLHWMRDMDTILVLDHGCIVQIGTYKELTACKDGTFAKLLATCKGGADCEGGNEENVARSHVNEQDGAEEGALA
jgi:ATP-binding cassette subfamily C protein CydD